MAQEQKPNLLIQIHDLINEAFDLDEFRELCLHLEFKYDNLRGETLSARNSRHIFLSTLFSFLFSGGVGAVLLLRRLQRMRK
jgi:hypothetical protein